MLFHASFHAGSATCSAAGVQFARPLNPAELRLVAPATLLGKWIGINALGDPLYFVLKKVA